MRFLKEKITRRAQLLLKHKTQIDEPPKAETVQVKEEPQIPRRRRLRSLSIISEDIRSTKNISKNFGRAICNFATSTISVPYLEPFLTQEKVRPESFENYTNDIKDKIDGLYSFRSVLMPAEDDSQEVLGSKKVFQMIAEVFIKYFSVNWIYHGKIVHKRAHLHFRFKMLRRIQSPELFTYVRKSSKKLSSKL